MLKPKIIIGRHINGITLNPLEYIQDKDGEVIAFDTEKKAKEFLREHAVPEKEIEEFVFQKDD